MNTHQSYLTRDSIADLLRLGSLVAIAVGLFAIVVAALAIYLNLSAQLELERADRAATQQADRIADSLADIQTSLRDASVVDAARSGSLDDLRTALRARGVSNMLELRLLPADVDEIAVGENINLDRTTTDIVIEAIRNERADIRVRQPGTPAESLVFAQRMPGDTGVLLLRLTVNPVVSMLREHELLDFVALAQRGKPDATVLGTRGSAAATVHEVPITGSSLVLQWHRAALQAPVDNQAAFILGCSGVIVMMLGLLLRRRTRLAHYLGDGASNTDDRVAAPLSRPGRGANAAPRPRNPAPETMILEPDDIRDDGPDTVVADPPELPDWLLDEDDAVAEAPSRRY